MKRLIVTLLTVCMVVGMFAGLSVTAFADYDTSDMVAYTMTAGDNVYNVCQKMGISFWDYENVIKTVNNIKSYSNISVGAVIYFPKPGAAATLPAGTGAAAGSTSTAGTTTPKTDSFEVKSDDKIAYYLVPHVMQTGEQIKDLCAAYGVDYYSYSAKIAKMNGLASCDNVRAGATVLIPSISAPSGECYRVIAHTVQPGDAVYNKCIEYGVDYYSNLTVLKGVNNTDNLNNIQAGNTLFIPIAGTANGSAGTGAGTGTGTGSTTPATGVVYNITIAAAANGKVSANVNGAAVVKAEAGSAVTVVATPDKGYALEGFTVAATSGGAAVLSTDEGFTMPAYAVTVTAKFKEASSYKATALAAVHGTVKLQPAGGTAAQSQKIAEGTKVTIAATADKGYALDSASIEVYNPNKPEKTVAVNGNSFIMPSHPVEVKVSFMSSKTYSCFISNDVKNGTYWIEVDGSKTDKVNEGKTVNICVDPDAGYEIQDIYYYQTTNNTYGVDLKTKQSFVMPAYDVTVVVAFKEAEPHAVGIDTTLFPSGCTLSSNVTTAVCGETVSLMASFDETAKTIYKLEKITVTADGAEIPVSADNTFTMPSTDVVVVATFAEGKYNVTLNVGANGTAKMSINGTESKKNPDKGISGKLVRIDVEPKLGYEAKVVATNANGNKEVTVKQSSEGYFYITMPEHAVVINVSFGLPTKTVYGPNYDASKGVVSLLKDGVKLDPQKAGKGDIVTISVEPAPGVAVKSVTVDDGAGTAKAIVTKVNDSTYTFKMPDEDVAVNVEFADPVKYAINLGAITNGTVSFVSDGYPVTEVGKGAKVQMTVTPKDGYKLKSIQVTKAGDPSTALSVSSNTFTMPGYAVEVTASFEPNESSTATYKIEKKYCYNGEYQVLAKSGDNQDTLKFAKGKTVYVKLKPNNGYVLDDIAITYNDGASRVPFTGSGSLYSFEMIDSNVSIRVTYKKG